MLYTHTDRYEGERNSLGERHGRGTLTSASGDKYVGEWKNDKKHGHGTYEYSSGEKYKGEWEQGKKHGRGTRTWASGAKYVGEWKNGKPWTQEDIRRLLLKYRLALKTKTNIIK